MCLSRPCRSIQMTAPDGTSRVDLPGWFSWLPSALVFALFCSVSAAFLHAAESAVFQQQAQSDSEVQANVERLFTALIRNPRYGTSFDRVARWHNQQGSLAALQTRLAAYGHGMPLPDDTDATATLGIPAACTPEAALLLSGMIALQRADATTAVSLLTAAAAGRATDPLPSWYLARAHLQLGATEAAITAFEQSLSRRPARTDLLELYRDYAVALTRARKNDEALSVWKRLEAAFPGDRRVAQMVAESLGREGRWSDALQRFEALASTATDPEERARLLLSSVELLQQLRRDADALQTLTKLLADVDPEGWLARDIRRRIEAVILKQRSPAQLVQFYEQWLQQHPEDLASIERLAAALQLDNRATEAEQWLQKAVELAPAQVSLRESLIEIQVRSGRLQEAAQQYQVLCAASGRASEYHRRLGLLHLQRTDLKPEERQGLALQAWSPLLSEAETQATAAAEAADLLEKAGLSERALELAQNATRLAPDQPQFVQQLGERLLRRQQPQQARDVWMRLARTPLRSPDTLLLLAEILQRAGFTVEALQTMREVCSDEAGLTERLQFAEMLRDAGGFGEAPSPASDLTSEFTSDACLSEALKQLDLALQQSESPEQQDQVLEQRSRLLLLSGRLPAELALLSTAEATTDADKFLNCWRRVLGHDADSDPVNAVIAAREALLLQPGSARVLNRLAALLEKSGRLTEAATVLQQLAEADPRQASATLQQLARTELRLGRADRALSAASRMTETWPDNPATWQFYAEIAFEAGQPAAAISALRQAVRVSPEDTEALKNLAGVLADRFETAESIQLLWQAFDTTTDADSRLDLLARMTSLALRSQHFPEFLERVERRPANAEEPVPAALELALVLQEAGDFRRARGIVESAIAVDPENEQLLRRAVQLAERERHPEAATRWQLQLVRNLNSLDEVRRLLALDAVDTRQFSAAELLRNAVQRQPQRSMIHEAVQLALAAQQEPVAAELCRDQLLRDPSDWWCRTWLVILAQRAGETEECLRGAEQVLDLRYPDLTGPLAVNVTQMQPSTEPSPSILQQWLTAAPAEPAVYGDAAKICLSVLLAHRESAGNGVQDMPQLTDFRWCATVAGLLLQSAQPDSRLLLQVDRQLQRVQTAAATALRLRLLAASRLKAAWLTAGKTSANLGTEIQLAGDALITAHPEWLVADQSLNPATLAATVRSAWQTALTTACARQPEQRIPQLQLAIRLQDSENCGRLLQQLASDPSQSPDPAAVELLLVQSLGTLIELRLDAVSLRAALQLALSCNRRQNRQLTPSLLTVEVPGIAPFRHRGTAPSTAENLVSRLLGRLQEVQPGSLSTVWPQLEQSSNISPTEAALLRCEYYRRRGDRTQLLRQLLTAATALPADASLRLWLAELLAVEGHSSQAIALASSARSEDPQTLIAAQQQILMTAQSAGQTETAIQAAKRLCELPLTQPQQAALLPVLGRLGLQAEAAALETRLGRTSESRTSILGRQLQQFLSAGQTDHAAEAAWELLRISSGGNLFSGYRPNDDRDDGGDRLQAIRALARMNRLQPLIDRHEAMLENSPDSLALLEVLLEFHEAAEHLPRTRELQDRIAVLSRRVPPGIKRQAADLEKNGQFSAACDLYLQLQRTDSAAFYSELETFYQTFERCNRRRDFLAATAAADRDILLENARLLISAAARVFDTEGWQPEVEHTLKTLLSAPETRRLALAAALQRTALASRDLVTAALTAELTALPGVEMDSATRMEATMAELLQLCQSSAGEQFLRTVHQHLSQPSIKTAPELALLAFVCVRLGKSGDLPALQQRIAEDLAVVSMNEDVRAISAAAAVLVMLEKTDLQTADENLLGFRQHLLQGLAAETWGVTGLHERAESLLLEQYRRTGREEQARAVVLKRVQSLRSNGVSGPDNIRGLLQASEQIQHSGNPIEAAALLLDVTPFDLARFTQDLGEDKAIAFRSRWNAARRWNLQQMHASRILLWLEQPAGLTGLDLLLEVSGTTDPGCTDIDQLQQLRLQSQLLTAVGQCDWTVPEILARLQQSITRLAGTADVPPQQLLIAAAAARSAGMFEMARTLQSRLVDITPAPAPTVHADSSADVGISLSLRQHQNLALLLLARQAVTDDAADALPKQLLLAGLPQDSTNLHPLVELAALNEALIVAEKLSLTEPLGMIRTRKAELTARQTQLPAQQAPTDLAAAIESLLQQNP